MLELTGRAPYHRTDTRKGAARSSTPSFGRGGFRVAASDTERLLGFWPEWRALGVINDASLAEMRARWGTGDDPNPEHYRWGAFAAYLHANRPLPPGLAADLYALGEADPDEGAGGAMMAAVVWLAECPPEVLARAAATGRRHLVRAVERRAVGAVPLRPDGG
ncbi:MAG: hypothetical protein C0467_27550 [Planctomycetaceae bacterium]|nr:hypothetical protein [Planctomycetaceae bacterium]